MKNSLTRNQPTNVIAIDEANVASSLTALYNDVDAAKSQFIRATCKFGANLIAWERYIGESRGRGNKGTGLAGWLADNCPTINYKTAMGYKAIAAKCIKMIGGGQMAEAVLIGSDTVTDPSGALIPVSSAVVARADELFASADTRRKIDDLYYKSMRQSSTKSLPNPADYASAKKTESECAVGVVWPIIQPILKHRGAWQHAIMLIPDDKLSEALATLNEFASAISRELKSRQN